MFRLGLALLIIYHNFDCRKICLSEKFFVGKFGVGKFALENLVSENLFRKIRC